MCMQRTWNVSIAGDLKQWGDPAATSSGCPQWPRVQQYCRRTGKARTSKQYTQCSAIMKAVKTKYKQIADSLKRSGAWLLLLAQHTQKDMISGKTARSSTNPPPLVVKSVQSSPPLPSFFSWNATLTTISAKRVQNEQNHDVRLSCHLTSHLIGKQTMPTCRYSPQCCIDCVYAPFPKWSETSF